MAALAALDALQLEVPEGAEVISELGSLYHKKLWHHLTVKIDALIKADGPLNRGNVFLRLFEGFISDFASRINLLKLAQFAVHASRSLPNAAAMIQFLSGVVTKLEVMKLAKSVEPILFVRMHIAQHHVELVSTIWMFSSTGSG